MNEEINEEMASLHEQPESKVAVSASLTAPKKQPKRQPGLITIVVLCLGVSFGASLVTIFAYDRLYAQKVVAVDIKGYIAQQRDNYLAGNLNDEELKRSFDRLETVITAIPKNRVVIMGDAVVRNAETVNP